MKFRWNNIPLPILAVTLFLVFACNVPGSATQVMPTSTHRATLTLTASISPSPTMTLTSTKPPTPTWTLTPSNTPTPTWTPTPEHTPTDTRTPTPEAATASAAQNVNCRWGPHSLYLAAGLFREGATAQIDGRDYGANWLWIQMEDFSYHCWVAASAVEVQGELDSVPRVSTDPPISSSVALATGVSAVRDGNKVTIAWNPADPAVDLHYLIRANICNGQYVLEWIDTTTNTVYTLQDKPGCAGTSSANIFVVNKKGYSAPVAVPWP